MSNFVYVNMDSLVDDVLTLIIHKVKCHRSFVNLITASRRMYGVYCRALNNLKRHRPSRVDCFYDPSMSVFKLDLEGGLAKIMDSIQSRCHIKYVATDLSNALEYNLSLKCDKCAKYMPGGGLHSRGLFRFQLVDITPTCVDTVIVDFLYLCKLCISQLEHTDNTYYKHYTKHWSTFLEWVVPDLSVGKVIIQTQHPQIFTNRRYLQK
jgi:hypothetical protein